MSANLDLVRSIHPGPERGDFNSAAWAHPEWAHPEIEFEIVDGPSPGRWRGVAGMIDAYREVLSAWEVSRAKAEEYRELDGERVLVLHRISGRGKTSETEIGANTAAMFYVPDGKVGRITLYWDRDHALADLGLEE